MPLAPASDGLPARVVQDWSFEKLFYIERYLDIFCTAMKDKWTLVYADLLCGPGMCVEEGTAREGKGSPLLAVDRSEFSRLFLNDLAPGSVAAVSRRIGTQPVGRVAVSTANCNSIVEECRSFLYPQTSNLNTLGLAVIDPTGLQIEYDTIRRLTDGLRMDLIIILMTDFIRRFLSTPEFEGRLDRFYGTDQWRQLRDRRNAGETVTYRAMLDLYEQQLRLLGYAYVDDDTRMLNSKQSTIYHIVFASKHPLGQDFYRKISGISARGQRRLL